jgi:hypothetical protein
MKNKCYLLTALAIVCLLAVWPRPAAAYIDIRPPTLGDLCRQATHIHVLRVDKVNAEKGIIVFKSVEQLKGEGPLALPDAAFRRHGIGPNVPGAHIILDWAAEGKTALLFTKSFGTKFAAHVYIDGYWYQVGASEHSDGWFASNGESVMLTRYCGPADKLGEAVTKMLRGEEVLVPAMSGDNREELNQRRAKVQEIRASLKILGEPKKNVDEDPKADGKQPDSKKLEPRTPDRMGTVKAVAADGKSFTLLPVPNAKVKEPDPIEIQIGDGAKIVAGNEPGKVAVGQTVSVWFGKGAENVAVEIVIGKLPQKQPNEKKPVDKKPEPGDKNSPKDNPQLVGTVKALAADGKSFTLLLPPTKKIPEPTPLDIQLAENVTITTDKEPAKLAIGQTVSVWLQKGSENVARAVHIGKPPEPPAKKPAPDTPEKKPDGKKPAPDDKKPNDKQPADKKPDDKKEK